MTNRTRGLVLASALLAVIAVVLATAITRERRSDEWRAASTPSGTPDRGRVATAPAGASNDARQREPDARPLETSRNDRASVGRLVGRVIDDAATGIPNVAVLVLGLSSASGSLGPETRTAPESKPRKQWTKEASSVANVRTDDKGQFDISLPAGQYRLLVDAKSLPAGVLAPLGQDVSPERLAPNASLGYGVILVVVTPDGSTAADLRVHREGLVQGYVFGPGRGPIVGASVRLQAVANELTSVVHDIDTDVSGRFELRGVYPGTYRMLVALRADHPMSSLARPVPREVIVPPGMSVTLDPVVLGGGPCAVKGSVVDQDQKPFAGLTVLLYSKQHGWGGALGVTSTDERGAYELGGLQAVPLVIQIGVRGMSGSAARGDEDLARPVEPIELDLRGAASLTEAPLRVAERAHRFRLECTIVLDSAWASRWNTDIRRARAQILTAAHVEARKAGSAQGAPRLLAPERPPIEFIDALTGRFTWQCETPHDAVTIELSCSQRGHPEQEDRTPPIQHVVQPVADRTETVTLQFQ